MKISILRRVLTLLICFVLVILSAACQATPTTSSTTANPNVTTIATTQATTKTTSAPVTLSISSSFINFPVGWLEWETIKKLQSDLNIKLEPEFLDADKMGLALASKSLTDVVIGNQASLSSIIANKMALNLDPVLKEFAPNLLNDYWKTRNEVVRNLMGGPEKAFYFLPANFGVELRDGGQTSPRGYNLRWDYYKEIGAPSIDNDQDFLNAIIAMVKLHPTTANGDKVYGIGNYDSITAWYTRACFTKAVSLNIWTFSPYQYLADWQKNELFNGYTNLERSAYWADMAFYNKAFLAGVFDTDSFTQKAEEYNTKMAKGQYVTNTPAASTDLYTAMQKTDPNTLAGLITIPSKGDVNYADAMKYTGNAPTCYTFIFSQTKKQKEALSFLNYISDFDNMRMLYSGIKGKYWDYDSNSKPYIFDTTIALKANPTDEYKNSGVTKALQTLLIPNSAGEPHPKDGMALELFSDPKYLSIGLNYLQKDYSKFYNVNYPAEACMKYVKSGDAVSLSTDAAQTISAGVPTIPTDIRRIMDSCNDIIYRAAPSLIQAKDAGTFASIQTKIMSDLKSANEDTAWQWIKTNYYESKTKMEALLKK